MSHHVKTLEQIRLVGLEALSRELGPVGMVRFLQQFETGKGDYSSERHQWIDHLGIEDLVKHIQQHRKEQ